MNEAETCRTLVRPRLEAAGWPAVGDSAHFKEQLTITPGRVVVAGGAAKRQAKQIPDFLLYFNRDLPLAVVEAKHDGKPAGHGMGQAKEYAAILGLQFVYATNGRGIVEFDAHTQQETAVPAFPSPSELFQRWQTARALTTAQANDPAQQRRGLGRLHVPETRDAPAVCCSDWFGVPSGGPGQPTNTPPTNPGWASKAKSSGGVPSRRMVLPR